MDDTNGQQDPWDREGSEGSSCSTGEELQVAAAGLRCAGPGWVAGGSGRGPPGLP